MALNQNQYQQRINELRKKAQSNHGPDQKIHNRIDILRQKRNGKGGADSKPGKVDQDPKPPNDPKPNGGGQSNVSQTSNVTPTTPLSREQQGFSSYKPQPGVPDPRDAQYWRDVTRLMFTKDATVQSLGTQQIFADTTYERNLQDLNRREPLDLLAQREAQNRAGALYSSRSAEDAAQLQTDYFNERSNLSGSYRADKATRDLEKWAAEQGYTVDEAQALADAVNRQSQSEMDRPSPYGGDLMKALKDILQPQSSSSKTTKHIDRLRDKLKKAEDPKDKARIRRRIRRLERKDNGEKQKGQGKQERPKRKRQKGR